MLVQEFFFELNDIEKVAASLLAIQPDNRIFFFEGNLGAGKTTLIKEMCKSLGVSSEMSSPTFSIVNEYETLDAQKVYHVDLYRIETKQDIVQIGLFDYLDSGSYCFIEWPSLLYDEVSGLRCELTIASSTSRKLAIFK